MRVQTEEWRRFIPGVRMYKGKKTLFYNGEILWEGDEWDGNPLIHDEEERNTWQVIIILPGVEVIPVFTFNGCENLETVIMSDTVKRIEDVNFDGCSLLKFVKLSRNLEFIGRFAFYQCWSLTSIFIPPSCREIDNKAFMGCRRLIILGLPQNVQLGEEVFQDTALIRASPFETINMGEGRFYDYHDEIQATQWIKSINNEDAHALHRVCFSFNPIAEIIHDLVTQHGITAMRMPNSIGITPSQYLEANAFAEISEKDIINRYILEMMGEVF